MDLLNPTMLDLSVREDINRGIYVENLTEQPVCSTEEVRAILRKANRIDCLRSDHRQWRFYESAQPIDMSLLLGVMTFPAVHTVSSRSPSNPRYHRASAS